MNTAARRRVRDDIVKMSSRLPEAFFRN